MLSASYQNGKGVLVGQKRDDQKNDLFVQICGRSTGKACHCRTSVDVTYKAMIFELFLICGTNCVLADD